MKTKLKLSLTLATFLSTALFAQTSMYINANVYTQNDKMPHAQAFEVTDGKFSFIGSNDEAKKRRSKTANIIDLKGNLVLPSFIDSHTHPGLVALTFGNSELSKYTLPTTSKKDMYDYLKKIAKENPNLPFLMVGTWSNPLFGVKGPDRKDIDKIFPKTAVILLDSSGHSYWLNTAAFKAFGIDDKTPDLKPGLSFFVKDKNGRKTGWVKEFALMPYLSNMPQPPFEILAPAIGTFLDKLASQGVSSVMDAGNFNNEETIFKAVKKLENEGKLHVRYEASHHLYMPSQLKTAVDKLLEYRKKYGGNLLKFNTIKIHFDGVNEINTAGVLEDFANEPGNKGGMLYDENELKYLLLQMAKHKLNLHLHTVGDRSIRTALNAYEKAQKEYGKKLPVQMTLSHLELVSPQDMKRFKSLGVHANFTPHWLGGTVFKGSKEALGKKRFAHNQPVGSLLKAGANVTFSSDVVSMPGAYRANPFLGIQMGITRQDPKLGKNTPVFGQKSDRVSLKEMIKGYTINNAKQMSLANYTGSIEVGKDADFMVLKDNIFNINTYDISKIKPKEVYFKGEKINFDKK